MACRSRSAAICRSREICADAMLRAITMVHRRYLAAGIRGGLVATVHDELLAEVVEADAERARDI